MSLPRIVLARQLAPRRCAGPWPSTAPRRLSHDNPLGLPPRRFPDREAKGLPRSGDPPTLPTRKGVGKKRRIPNVEKVVVVASGKGGVGKSTVAANLAAALSVEKRDGRSVKVGLLDLDVFGPSVPKLMGLESAGEPDLTPDNALVPMENHGIRCMSIGFLIPQSSSGKDGGAAPVVWRGMMVMKAVQQLLFDVDWRGRDGRGLDVLVVDMPPGTGDVALSVGQLVEVDGAVIVSTPQDVALLDARRGVAMFKAVSIPIIGLVLNMSHFVCPSCSTPHRIFGPPDAVRSSAAEMGTTVVAEVPLEGETSARSDSGRPVALSPADGDGAGRQGRAAFAGLAAEVWTGLHR